MVSPAAGESASIWAVGRWLDHWVGSAARRARNPLLWAADAGWSGPPCRPRRNRRRLARPSRRRGPCMMGIGATQARGACTLPINCWRPRTLNHLLVECIWGCRRSDGAPFDELANADSRVHRGQHPHQYRDWRAPCDEAGQHTEGAYARQRCWRRLDLIRGLTVQLCAPGPAISLSPACSRTRARR